MDTGDFIVWQRFNRSMKATCRGEILAKSLVVCDPQLLSGHVTHNNSKTPDAKQVVVSCEWHNDQAEDFRIETTTTTNNKHPPDKALT